MLSRDLKKIERWLGVEKVELLSRYMRGWYGPPIPLLDVPGDVRVCGDGDFIGRFDFWDFRGVVDVLKSRIERLFKCSFDYNTLYAGFASISDALKRASSGEGQMLPFVKSGSTGVAGVTNSLWRAGSQPPSGAAPGNAPSGTVYTKDSTGALGFNNPSSGTLHLVGADVSASVANNTLLLYDLLFGCNKNISTTSAEAVTGVPTRYQNTDPSAPDYIGGNFLFIQVGGTALSNTAHNHTVVKYKNQNDVEMTLPTLAGVASAIVDRLDQPTYQWFAPLAAGDVGIKALTQMQLSASLSAGVLWYMIGHPIGFMSFPVASSLLPFDWLTNRNQTPRIFNDACLAFLELLKPSTTATTYTGVIHILRAEP